MRRRPLWIGCVLIGLIAAIAAPLRAQLDQPATDFVILKGADVTASSLHLSIIVVRTKAEAGVVLSKLQSGARFDALAREYSTHPTATDAGDFGVFPFAELRPEFRAAVAGIKSGAHTEAIAVQRRPVPDGWPENLPVPGDSLKNVELALGRSYLTAAMPADAGSTMTELTYSFGLRLRVHESRGLGFMEFTPPWKASIFGIRPDDPLPSPVLDALPRTGRFIRGVFANVPGHPNWFIDVDDRVDAVSRMLFVDRNIYGNLPGLPKAP